MPSRQFDPNGISFNTNTGSIPPTTYQYSTDSGTTIASPVSGEPILSKWNWDSGEGKLSAEILTPQGVVVIVKSEAPSLKGQYVLQVYLISVTATRKQSLALDTYNFRLKIQMTDGQTFETSGIATVTDADKEIMKHNPDYVTKPVYKKPVDRTKYINWICSHMIEDDQMLYCDECKTKHKER